MFSRHSPAGNWLYPLISALALLILTSAAVYALTNVWRERTDGLAGTDSAPDPPAPAPAAATQSLSAVEILDRRLASGEIKIAEYEELLAVLSRRHATPPAAAAASNGAAAAAAV